MAYGKMCVLMVSLPLQGHIGPMFRFAERLTSKGVSVTVATLESGRDTLTKHNNSSVQLEFFSDGLNHGINRDENIDLMLEALPKSGSKNLSTLITNMINDGQKISCIIVNPFVPWVADVAAHHDIPCAMLFVQAFALYATYNHFCKDDYALLKHFDNSKEATVYVPGFYSLGYKDLPTFILPSTPYHFRKLMLESTDSLKKMKWVLGNSFYELEADLLQSIKKSELEPKPVLVPVGPLMSCTKAEDSCIKWLNTQECSSVIYIAFGSITVVKEEQIKQIALALKTLNRPFLWVVKEEEKKFLTMENYRGMMVSWCSQEKVLSHPAIACFISHCGWNSTLEAIVGGVPIIAFPGWTDQPTNAKLIVEVFKIGVRLLIGEDGIASQEEVKKCVWEITNGPEAEGIKQQVVKLKNAAKKAMQEGGSSDQNIDFFIKEIMGK